MDYKEAVAYIHSTLWKGSRLGLTRMTELAQKMGNPQSGMKFIHIAGTNGKGSTAAMLAAVFRESGYRTGLFTSPYITRFNERIQIDSVFISDGELASETEYVKRFAETMEDSPTEFELITAIALSFFRRKECDIVILEVGLGGELDSTNVIDTPELAVITAIGMDHTAQLGSSISEIAAAKAGIIKPIGDVIAYKNISEADGVIASVCRDKGARLIWASSHDITPHGMRDGVQVFDWGDYKCLELSLLGSFQMRNCALVLGAVDILRERAWDISDTALRNAFKTVHWPGRFEVLQKKPFFLLDGGHNPQGVEAAAGALKDMLPGQKFVFITGIMADKDLQGLYAPLLPLAEAFVTVTPQNPRAMDAADLALSLRNMGAISHSAHSIESGILMAKELCGGISPICAIGSLYMAGAVRDIVLNKSDL